MAVPKTSKDDFGFLPFLKRNQERFLDLHGRSANWRLVIFSATAYATWKAANPVMVRHCGGRVLDGGAGRGVFSKTILKTASAYESIDLAPRGGHRPTWTGDITEMPEVPAGRYDTVVCQQVLEHVSRPWRAVAEFRRVLKPGGKVIVSVPHLSRRHELPHDYFRYTQEGLVSLLKDTGYEILEVAPYGGILSFLHHQTSFIFPGLLTGIPILGTVALLLNAPFSWLFAMLDSAIDRASLIPLGVIAVARKPAAARNPQPDAAQSDDQATNG